MLNAGEYERLLVEIASYGYVIAADGNPSGSSGSQSKVQDMRDSIDWAFAGKAKKYGNIDLEKVTTAGHSCGGLEAMSTAYHDDRIKRIIMFNIAIFQDDRRYLLQEIKVPVVYLIGGSKDMGYTTVSSNSVAHKAHLLTCQHSPPKTTPSSMLVFQSFGQTSIPAMEEHSKPRTVASREKQRSHIWSGSGEAMLPRRHTS